MILFLVEWGVCDAFGGLIFACDRVGWNWILLNTILYILLIFMHFGCIV